MKKVTWFILAAAIVSMIASILAGAQTPAATAQGTQQAGARGQRGNVASVNSTPRFDVSTMALPIAMHDTVWMEDLTLLEIRDLLMQGKTTALILTGGVEENGPYLTTGKHNNVLRVTGDAIARKLGNALCAPIVTLEPGNPIAQPGRTTSAGSTFLSEATYEAVLTDMANSLKSQGFKYVFFLGDSGGNGRGMTAAAKAFNDHWKGEGGVLAAHIPEYYNYGDVEKFEQDVLGIHEKVGTEAGGEGYHDDYYISALIMLHDLNGVRMPERMLAHKTSINGVDLAPGGSVEKTLMNARKMVEFRADAAVKAIHTAIAKGLPQ